MNPDFNANDYLNADELALYLEMENATALEYARRSGGVCAPDTVFEGRAYWSCDTAKELFAARLNAIREAFGNPATCSAETAPDPLRNAAVVTLRFKEGREAPMPNKPVDPRYSCWGFRLDAAVDGGASGDKPQNSES